MSVAEEALARCLRDHRLPSHQIPCWDCVQAAMREARNVGLTEDPDEARNSGIDPETGMQRKYVVLSDEERAKGFVRPVRRTYVHLKCGTATTMGLALAETYAARPDFYGGTFCAGCGTHYPVGEHGEFIWDGTDEKVGT